MGSAFHPLPWDIARLLRTITTGVPIGGGETGILLDLDETTDLTSETGGPAEARVLYILPRCRLLLAQTVHDLAELGQGGLEVLGDLQCQHVRFGQVLRLAQRVVLDPEDVQIQLVPLRQFLMGEVSPTAVGIVFGEVKAVYGAPICLVGNIDCGDLLPNGTPAQVEQAVRAAIAVGAPGGRYMLSLNNSVHAGVNPESFPTMITAGHRYGE